MAELRRRKAAKRPDAVAARRAQEEAERQAERERLARDVERQRTRPITILTAARWLGESPKRTLTRVVRGDVGRNALRNFCVDQGTTDGYDRGFPPRSSEAPFDVKRSGRLAGRIFLERL